MLEVHTDGGEALVEAADEVKDERTISDNLAQVAQGIRHGLELVAAVGDGEIALDEISKGSIEVERALLAVAEELVLQCDGAGSGSGTVVPNNLLEVGRDSVEEPRHEYAVHTPPVGVVWSAVSARTWR